MKEGTFMNIPTMVQKLNELQEKSGEEGWGGDFREDCCAYMLAYLEEPNTKKSLRGLLSFILRNFDDANT